MLVQNSLTDRQVGRGKTCMWKFILSLRVFRDRIKSNYNMKTV
jgi:hypothetical protein